MQKYWAVAALFLTISASAIFPGSAHGAAAITFVQGNYAVPQSPQATVTVPFGGAQTAGNLNVVVVGWNDSTASVTGVTDSKGNAYSLGVGPTVMTGNASQAIYFAKNIAAATAGANVVTVRFNVAAVYPDIRVLEYSGLDIANPLVGHTAAVGNSALSNGGSLTTTTPNVLLVAANVVGTTTSGPGANFTNRMITNPDGDIVEDRIVTAAGTYSGTAPLSSGYWVMQLVAFTAPGSGSPPTVSITAPAANATVRGTVTITATASDSVGVAGVQFKVDGANLGAEVTTAPYSIAWNTAGASNGPHSLTAVARNTSNLTTTSAAVPVTVSNTPPTVSITAPAANATVSGTVTITATASDSVGVAGVQFKVDSANLGAEVTTAPYSIAWNTAGASNGSHSLTAVARNTSNLTTTSAAVPVTVSNAATPPTVSITSPGANATVSGTVTITATASDNVGVAGVQFKVDGANLGAEVTTAPYSIAWNTTGASSGSHSLTAVARNTSNLTTTSAAVPVMVNNTPPTVSITAPAANATVSGTVTITATASDNLGIAGVQFKVDGANLGAEVTTAPYSIAWNTATASNGVHSLTAVARNTANLTTASAPVSVTVNNASSSNAVHFVQANFAAPQAPQSSVTVPYTTAQTAGNLNVVVAGWSDTTAVVTAVTDTAGNTYARAVGPTVQIGTATQSIYYAANISGAASNSVTVRFNSPAAYADIRIAEYSGVDNRYTIDVTAAAMGNSNSGDSGAAATANANDLLFGANLTQGVTTGPGSGFTSRIITSPDGDIVEDRVVSAVGTYSATAPQTGAAQWIMQMVAFRAAGSPPPPPPSVSITAPTNGASVSGSVLVTATASSRAVTVQFFLDGTPLGPQLTSAPYSILWDTTGTPTGNHTLTATAQDAAGISGTSPGVTVTIPTSSATVRQQGEWSGPFAWPLVAVNMVLLHTGDVLAWDGQDLGSGSQQVWNRATGQFTPFAATDNLFCSGATALSDGRVLVAGGHITGHTGLPDTNIFDPVTQIWSSGSTMAVGRWYPTVTALPDGRVLVTSGEINCSDCDAPIPEVYDPSTNVWTQLTAASLTIPYYPHMFVIPDGRVLNTSTAESPVPARALNVAARTWTTIDSTSVDGGSAAMYLPGKVIKSGTSTDADNPSFASSPNAYVLDMTAPTPAWRATAPMAFARTYHNMVMLPDGTVLVVGGNGTTDPIDATTAVYAAEVWSPTTQTWTTLANMTTPRLYHSTALLLPDGRVLVAGGGRFAAPDPSDRLSAEIFSPPYLFKNSRPTITQAPTNIQYGTNFPVATPDAARIASVALIKLGAVTHAFDQEQRFVSATFQPVSGGITVQAPANANLAPPGYYMLFLVDSNGVPSVAPIVRIH